MSGLAGVGAPHGRFRVFIVANPQGKTGGERPADRSRSRISGGADSNAPADTDGRQFARPTHGLYGLPVASERALLPTPVVNDMGNGKTPDDWDGWTADMQDRRGNGHGKSLAIEAQRLLPTPRATDGTKGGPNQRGSSGDLMLPSAVQRDNLTPTAQAAKHGSTPDVTANGYGSNLWDVPTLLPTPTRRDHKGRNQRDDDTCLPGAVADYGQYAPAIARWEQVIGEPAPPPTIQGRNGPRLNPDLPRWMMGFPAGWLDGLTPSQQLKAAGNAVCQQQAELALRILLGAA